MLSEGAYFEGDKNTFSEKRLGKFNLDTIIHVASFGMSGIDMLTAKMVHEVNYTGTVNVVEACIKLNIANFVYTSSYNAVFYGQRISNAVDVAYPELNRHVDEYSKSKTRAEKFVLSENGKPLQGGGRLRTIAVRPAAIYGPAELRHFPRIISNLHRGILRFTIGSEKDLVDWVYIDNLVYGHLLAAEKIQDQPMKVSGKAYPISDQTPMNNWLFLKPLFQELGYWYPVVKIPTIVMFYFAYSLEALHWQLSKVGVKFEPFLSRAEVVKVGVEHYFNPSKVQQDLGYKPIVSADDGIKYTVKYFKMRELDLKKKHGAMYLFLQFIPLALLLILLYLVIKAII